MQKNIAFFDFDGTITNKDTMLELAKYEYGLFKYLLGICLISPWLLAMKIGLISNQQAKEKFLSYFFKNRKLEKFNSICLAFAKEIIPGLIKQKALQRINLHKLENTVIVIVSASAENWVAPWCDQNGIQFICTKLEARDGVITGKLFGKNCNGAEKVSRIKEKFNTADFEKIYCYGDTKGDKQLLELATHPFYKLF